MPTKEQLDLINKLKSKLRYIGIIEDPSYLLLTQMKAADYIVYLRGKIKEYQKQFHEQQTALL